MIRGSIFSPIGLAWWQSELQSASSVVLMIILSLYVRKIERILLFVRLSGAEHRSTSVDLSSDRQGLPAQMR